MKVILLQNVPKLGQKDDIKEVSEGYARNLLFPRKLAKEATSAEVKKIKSAKRAGEKKVDLIQSRAHDLIKRIDGSKVNISAKANEKGHLFAQIHLKEVADAIGSLGYDISEDWINLENPIKEVGEFSVSIEAYGKKGSVAVVIEGGK